MTGKSQREEETSPAVFLSFNVVLGEEGGTIFKPEKLREGD
jgi:hypothetical protein